MGEIQWIPVLVGVGFGGLAGAVLNGLISSYKSRIQPVGYRLQFFDLFSRTEELDSLGASLAIVRGEHVLSFNNLFLARLTVTNTGNADIETFSFGASLSGDSKTITVKAEAPDRHHTVQITTPVAVDNPVSDVDFVLSPFNRRDSYSFDILISVEDPEGSHGPIQLSSAHPIRFSRELELKIEGNNLTAVILREVANIALKR